LVTLRLLPTHHSYINWQRNPRSHECMNYNANQSRSLKGHIQTAIVSSQHLIMLRCNLLSTPLVKSFNNIQHSH
jgi:hypothetical protein